MDVNALVVAYVGAQSLGVQMAAAARMMRMNAEAHASVVQVLNAAQDNMKALAATTAEIGGNLDISV
jgi:hypothetical protein